LVGEDSGSPGTRDAAAGTRAELFTWLDHPVDRDSPAVPVGCLSTGVINLSRTGDRYRWAKHCEEKSHTKNQGLDWLGMIDELAQLVIKAERAGAPAVILREIPRPTPADGGSSAAHDRTRGCRHAIGLARIPSQKPSTRNSSRVW
jgi:hypothetical protein